MVKTAKEGFFFIKFMKGVLWYFGKLSCSYYFKWQSTCKCLIDNISKAQLGKQLSKLKPDRQKKGENRCFCLLSPKSTNRHLLTNVNPSTAALTAGSFSSWLLFDASHLISQVWMITTISTNSNKANISVYQNVMLLP